MWSNQLWLGTRLCPIHGHVYLLGTVGSQGLCTCCFPPRHSPLFTWITLTLPLCLLVNAISSSLTLHQNQSLLFIFLCTLWTIFFPDDTDHNFKYDDLCIHLFSAWFPHWTERSMREVAISVEIIAISGTSKHWIISASWMDEWMNTSKRLCSLEVTEDFVEGTRLDLGLKEWIGFRKNKGKDFRQK